jgi:hypothetical protein
MEAMPRRSRPRQSSRRHSHSNGHGTGVDRLALVRDRERVDLISDLDAAYDALLAKALDGDDASYQIAASVKTTIDYLIDLQLNAAR